VLPTVDREALRLFVLVCDLPKRQSVDWQVAKRECANLHAELGGDARAAYVTTTAYAFFLFKEDHDASKRHRAESAQQEVLAELQHPSPSWSAPTSGFICEWATEARSAHGNPTWMRFSQPRVPNAKDVDALQPPRQLDAYGSSGPGDAGFIDPYDAGRKPSR
jgi:hypothetical protein